MGANRDPKTGLTPSTDVLWSTTRSTASARSRRNRQRNAEGEHEIVALVRDDLGLKLRGRRLGQERGGGHDVDIGPLRAQVKRRRRIAGLHEWLDEADVACVCADGCGWLVVMEWATFLRLAREEIAPCVANQGDRP